MATKPKRKKTTEQSITESVAPRCQPLKHSYRLADVRLYRNADDVPMQAMTLFCAYCGTSLIQSFSISNLVGPMIAIGGGE